MDSAYEARTAGRARPLDDGTSPPRPARRPSVKRRWLVSVMGGTDRTEELADEHVVLDVMGGSDLDLRHARFPAGEARVTAIAIMGGSDIWVPEGARVEFSGFALMGGNDNRSRRGRWPAIRVRAWSLMGGIDVRSGSGTATESAGSSRLRHLRPLRRRPRGTRRSRASSPPAPSRAGCARRRSPRPQRSGLADEIAQRRRPVGRRMAPSPQAGGSTAPAAATAGSASIPGSTSTP